MRKARRLIGGHGFLAVVIAVAPFMTACGPGFGPPDLESTRGEVPPEHYLAYDGETDRTVLDLLRQHADSVETSSYGGEFLVVSINGITNGNEGRYWFFYVNGEAAQTAASEYETTTGDRIEWLFAE